MNAKIPERSLGTSMALLREKIDLRQVAIEMQAAGGDRLHDN